VYVPGRSSDLRIISPGCAFPPGKEAVASGSRQSPHTAPALKRYGFAPYSLFSADPSDPRHQIQYVRLFMPSGRQKSNLLSRSPCFPVVVCKKMEYNFANKTRRISLTRISHKDRCERPESALQQIACEKCGLSPSPQPKPAHAPFSPLFLSVSGLAVCPVRTNQGKSGAKPPPPGH